MKLPDFLTFQPLNEARQKMQATLPEKPLPLKERTRRADGGAVQENANPAGKARQRQGTGQVGVTLDLRIMKALLGVIVLLMLINIGMLVRFAALSEEYEKRRTDEVVEKLTARLEPKLTADLSQHIRGTITGMVSAILNEKAAQTRRRAEMGYYSMPVQVPTGAPAEPLPNDSVQPRASQPSPPAAQ